MRHLPLVRRLALLAGGGCAFCVLVLLNVGGYRFGVSDQAFYIPVVLHSVDPELFPHFARHMAAQDRLFAFDDWLAPVLRGTGVSVPVAFLAGYVLTLLLLYGAAVGIGCTLYGTWWGVAGLVAGLTLRHQILDTAVNTLEPYFHPRMMAFGLGLVAVALFLRRRTWTPLAIVAGAFFVHPTTAAWFAVWLLVAALVAERDARRRLAGVTLAAGGAAALAVLGQLRAQLVVMDETWLGVLASKDYLLADEWPLTTWALHLAVAALIAVVYGYRRAVGLASARETGLVVGCGALLLLFLISVPLSAARLALAVQLQLNRIFWPLDVFATCYLGWLLFESPLWLGRPTVRTRPAARYAAVAVVVALAVARGGHVMFVERAGHPLVRTDLAVTDWTRVMSWASGQPVGTHFLAEPGHTGDYGASLRAASGRDVYLDGIKDIGIAIYSRDMAHDMARRVADLGRFQALHPQHARSLARRYDLDYLISEESIDLPLARRFGRFAVYALHPNEIVAAPGMRPGGARPQDD